MATVTEPSVTAGPTAGTVRSAREGVPVALWDKQVGLLMRDYPYDSITAARVWGRAMPTR
ncbi:hypothetical protein ABZ918_32555 [Streptomyces viridosporus]|uniref:hypothetical protein n=1 Tax=Streptomyces viridosporus TaxID=67581 RepID=UPI003430611F